MKSNIFDLTGKNALIVGGLGAIGEAIVEAYIEMGANCAIIDKPKHVNTLSRIEKSRTAKPSLIEADISIRSQINDSFERALVELDGKLDVLVNSAGIQHRESSEKFSLEKWDEILSVNLTSVFMYSQLAAIHMLSKLSGRIINIASIMHNFGGKTISGYSASKGGVVQLTKAMSNDLVGRGINVNAIAPGYISTPMNQAILKDEIRSRAIEERIPMKRWGRPSDLQGAAVFLASSASEYVSGTVVTVDGGYSAC
jgi:2-deoxy-D-gluconate 3-dehydrogenase